MIDPTAQFESRKKEHLRIALSPESQTPHLAGFDRLRLRHEALPDLNFADIDTSSELLGHPLTTPFFISSMTAGHTDALSLNQMMAKVSQARGWAMGVGSQRRELFDSEAKREWRGVREAAPKAVLIGNLGIAQVIHTPVDKIRELVDNLEAQAFFIHLNPLQECMQPEGNLNFAGSAKALANLVKQLGLPVVVKETGCGLSEATIRRLFEMGVAAVDVAGTGGTHWGRVEGLRSGPTEMRALAAQNFSDWGYSTIESLITALKVNSTKVWASGGVRSGLDAAKLLAVGAQHVGFAKPILEAALQGEAALNQTMERFEFELKVALFCTGSKNLRELKAPGVWEWI